MKIFAGDEPLTESEFDRLEEFLRSCNSGLAMNLEEMDGFFAALIAGADLVLPSEYLPEVFGSETLDDGVFEYLDQANDILGLLTRHWNTIAATLYNDDLYYPILFEDETGVCAANDWVWGFMCGVEMRRESWAEFIAGDEDGGWLLPVMILYHEHDEDPEMRPPPITPEAREDIIAHMVAGLSAAYRYFRPERQSVANHLTREPQRHAGKVGRNDPCPCGSGKKYKRCCGGATIH